MSADTLSTRLRTAIGTRPVDQVARLAGIDRQTLRRLLHDKQKRGAFTSTIRALAEVLGVSPAWLAFGDQEAT